MKLSHNTFDSPLAEIQNVHDFVDGFFKKVEEQGTLKIDIKRGPITSRSGTTVSYMVEIYDDVPNKNPPYPEQYCKAASGPIDLYSAWGTIVVAINGATGCSGLTGKGIGPQKKHGYILFEFVKNPDKRPRDISSDNYTEISIVVENV